MKFINLTVVNGSRIRINMDLIESYGTITSKSYYCTKPEYVGKTFLCYLIMKDDDLPYIVNETAEEIDRMLEEIK